MVTKIKVLRIITRLNVGGPAIHTALLTEGLDKNRFESLLVCGTVSPEEGDMAYYASQKGVRPLCIAQLRRALNPLNDLIAFIKILGIIKREKPDIIHTHTAKAGTLGRLAGIVYNCERKLLRFACGGTRNDAIRLIHTFHGHIFEGYFNKFIAGVFIVIERILACFSSKIITVSEGVKRELIELGICNSNKIKVIPLGLELDKFLEIVPGNDEKNINIGIVGRLVPVKNHHLFLEAVGRVLYVVRNNELKGNSCKLNFKIIGDGELRGMLEEYAQKLKVSDCVEFVGWQRDLIKVYSELDIVCLTSLNEGTPVSLIEAMASGKAVIATDVGGVRDLLGQDRGIVVESHNVGAFVTALLSLLADINLRERLGKGAREFVRERFTKQRLLKDIEELYLNI